MKNTDSRQFTQKEVLNRFSKNVTDSNTGSDTESHQLVSPHGNTRLTSPSEHEEPAPAAVRGVRSRVGVQVGTRGWWVCVCTGWYRWVVEPGRVQYCT